MYKTRRVIGPNSYNDNWDLVRYTSELRNSKGNFFAFVDFNENEGKIRECPHCLEYEIHNKLQPRILKKGEVKPPDYDEFVQCYECGNVFPIYEAHFESEIKDSLETVNNPFENSESVFLCTDNKASQRRKRERKDHYRKGVHKYTSKRLADDEQEDPDIQAEIDKGKIVNILYDSSR
ncbi:MAG: hypothetical protein M3O68_05435 [Thermoproteota archaeon]|jgi:hypothetical protein|nr:hypothetical protein [Thermoproteota archaeon]